MMKKKMKKMEETLHVLKFSYKKHPIVLKTINFFVIEVSCLSISLGFH